MSRTWAQLVTDAEAAGTLAKKSTLDNVISNTDAGALDSLTEIVTAFQAADGTINGAITSLANSAASNLAAEASRATAAESAIAADVASAKAALDALIPA